MHDMSIPCTCCGTPLTFPEEAAVRDCPACGTRNARPHSSGDTLQILQRAMAQRLACDFHNAELSYQQVLLFRPDEHEALWGRLLCHYGVEYVEDPVTRRRMPTVHTVRAKPLQSQPDFRKACEFAPPQVRTQYELDAAYIDDAQANIRQLAKSCQPYDVFLCHKTTKPGSSDKTEDFHRATQLYHFLKEQGVRVFFAPESLQTSAGANYEAGIYHALHTAKVMLLVCSEAEYLTSAWVRSEWSRFMELAESEPERQLIPLLYDHFDPANLPPQFIFLHLQGLDMTSITAPQTLLQTVQKAIALQIQPASEPASPKPAAPQPKPAAPAARAGTVMLEFPRRIPEWKGAHRWALCRIKGRKPLIARFNWGKTALAEISETTPALVREDHVSGWWPLFVLLPPIIAFFVLGMILSNLGDAGLTIWIITWYAFTITFEVIYIRRIVRHFRKVLPLTLVPGRSYRFYWDENEKLAVEEINS